MAKKADSRQSVSKRRFDAAREETTENVVRKSQPMMWHVEYFGIHVPQEGKCTES
ncbi:hypothetical protein LCGC14_1809340 [marine sediment metagenome]|uniref:Uncharacterized protein n=1 Tax=marine sediment metagenome TaxID=412755 RepID=A0A0F9JLX1_9ZZZZ